VTGRIQRYIQGVLQALLLTLGVIVLAIVLVDVVEQRARSAHPVSIVTAFRLTMKTPGLILNAALRHAGGVDHDVLQLSRRSGIPAIRASGVRLAVSEPAMVLAVVVGR
jgi:hypothetical protein